MSGARSARAATGAASRSSRPRTSSSASAASTPSTARRFDVGEGSITALIGPNGAGKTTLFNVITGFYRADRGHGPLRRRGDLAASPPYAIARRGMVRTFQITKALAAMPVIDNMMLAAPDQPGEQLAQPRLPPGAPRARASRRSASRRWSCSRSSTSTKLADDYAGTLSGGQRKLLELARALMAKPRLLLLDEPMAGINPTLGRRLLDHMQRLRAEDGVTFLFIEHDMEVVMNHSDRVIVMAEGRVIAEGEPHEVRADQARDRRLPRRLGTRSRAMSERRHQRAGRCSRPRTWSPATCPRSTSSTASRSRSARARS